MGFRRILTRVKEIPSSGVRALERGFYKLGVLICLHPWRTISLSLLLTLLGSAGLLRLEREGSPLKLWVPPESRFATDTEWLLSRVGVVLRPQHALATAPDVLQAGLLAKLAQLHENVEASQTPFKNSNISYADVCFRVPVVASSYTSRRRRSPDNSDNELSPFDDDFFDSLATSAPRREFDPSIDLTPGLYCSILASMPRDCLRLSILDLWKFDSTTIETLLKNDIVEALNSTTISPTLGHPMAFEKTLGGIVRDPNGKILSAKSILLTWYVFADLTGGRATNDAGTEEWASDTALAWENEFIRTIEAATANFTDANLYYEAGRSFGDSSGDTMFRDGGKLAMGIFLMFIYLQLILSKWNWLEIKLTLGSVGLMCVGMALVTACGLCGVLGIPYGPVHNSLPFLLMGLGIDDMFVMKACWESQSAAEKKLPSPERVGSMLQHAGVSIVVTSFTDIVAFLVGSITILPSLQSFCLYAATGVFFIFIYSITFYVAIFVLDLRRIKAKRNGVLFCIKHPDFDLSKTEQTSFSHIVMRKFYSKVVFTRPIKALVIIFTIVVTGVSMIGLFRLEQRFDPAWFVPDDNYFSKFLSARKEFYPEMGNEGMVIIGALNYSHELPKIYSMLNEFQNHTDLIEDFDPWTVPFETYVSNNFKVDVHKDTLSDDEWSTYLSKFLFSPKGSKYLVKFIFNEELICGQPAPPVNMSMIDFRFKVFSGPEEYIPAKHLLESIVHETDFTTGEKYATVWAKIFSNWVTDEVIKTEVERNLGLALLCVMVCTSLLITDVQVCFWIFMCVLLTLINVCGWMQMWGLTVDIVTCVALELGIGFCVDYAAHVGHTFLTVHGTRESRALDTVTSIGAAVLYGGGSTLVSLSVLSFSETYIFKTFFKIFFLVILFGLFNGLLFLPVILSLIGPKPYKRAHAEESAQCDNFSENEKGEELIETANFNMTRKNTEEK